MHPLKATTPTPTGWWSKLARRVKPERVVNICFVVVLFFSTLLTWRETIVLEDAYISSQRNNLKNVANDMDAQLQFNTDRLLFFRNGMQSALQVPLAFEVLRAAEQQFERQRAQSDWQISLNNNRTLPLHGVSDAFVEHTNLLSRDNPLLGNEFMATIELGYLLRLSAMTRQHLARFETHMLYVSRAGFYLSTDATQQDSITEYYYRLATSPWFTQQSQRDNPNRGVKWQTTFSRDKTPAAQTVTAAVPLDYEQYWFGVLAIQLSVNEMTQFLTQSVEGEEEGEYQLYDRRMNLIASSESDASKRTQLSQEVQAQLAHAYEQQNEGSVRQFSRYISWEKLRNFDGVLLRIHSLEEGVRGDFGSISIALTLLWVLFTTMLIISWIVIRRMVRNMSTLQDSLAWRAWHDMLTRLYNRGALFERASKSLAACQKAGESLAVIQLDLDHFKSINDRFGHQAGDRVLIHIGRVILNKIRKEDIAGRVGGEEFCLVLPDTSLAQATVIAERIRESINSREILISRNQTIRVSASLGVCSSDELAQYDFQVLQSIADKRLYLAKTSGRNRVCAEDGEDRDK
ncbi:cellulose biosynthesis regulator diguanylate cyclase DgcQ [Kluyvera ascorbata]|uniref:cellulose biosynthesis regulator diguanylate cyclase DgcQ n=1 Tax=Kluyvera ascorbata TaxID=51288 RepID=UPI0004E3FB92|nr:cellulose biosynthesis regulator diguanylate cyclase DgcQ [Kluyvera ascorbata]KFC93167.1 putative diguanylate cyclase [Kluyvera ascorbata ATCC 33433]MDU1194619.1 cellulose biosynthesis regulator diguanylate cyclase DgcQ [Kluyvera ascorbata]BCA39141.1 diguanylate cyclase [Kluyvera ascorbata]STW98378.1 Diguanylate cyclase DosC [Kluyvera ascorbata]